MSGPRMQIARTPGTLKAAEAALVTKAGGIKSSCIVGKSVLQQCTDEAHPDRHLSAHVIAELETLARDPIVTRYLALTQNQLLVPLHDEREGSLPLALSRITSETGKLLSEGAVALREKQCPPNEIAIIEGAALKVAAACGSLIAECRATREGASHG